MTWCGILAWTLEFHPDAVKQLAKLAKRDRVVANRIAGVLAEVGRLDDPRDRGAALTGNLSGLWKYRVGDWRVIADLQDDRLVVLALDIDHRSRVYRR